MLNMTNSTDGLKHGSLPAHQRGRDGAAARSSRRINAQCHRRCDGDQQEQADALGLGPRDLINDMESFGLFFEPLAIRDLRIYSEALGGSVYHYRDKNGLECDAVIHLRNGSYGLIEIKIGGSKLIDEGADNLKTLSGKIDTTKMKKPSFLMVLTGIGSCGIEIRKVQACLS